MVKIGFTGDIMLSRRVGNSIEKDPSQSLLSPDVEKIFKGFDFVVGNLECPVAQKANPQYPNSFKASPYSLKQIKNFDMLTLANNHIYDCGEQGALETVRNLEIHGFLHLGLKTEENNDIIKTKSIKGLKLGFVSCAVPECIQENSGGKSSIISTEDTEILEEIENHKNELDYIFVIIHGGNEMIPYPDPGFRDLCRRFIDSGASSVITHHPHVLGGFEKYKNKFIFYSLGDFIFDGESSLRRKGSILSLNLSNSKISWSLFPTEINKELVVIKAHSKTEKLIRSRWNKVSRLLLSDKYDLKYRNIYTKHLMLFQFDRMFFMIRNKGLLSTLKFLGSKAGLLRFYLKKINALK